ncbi:hypothetical protein BH18THE1_BH18THE1_16080 [soil metagenome]
MAYYFIFDNKSRYIDSSSAKKNYANIKSDIIKLFTIFSISEIIYSASKITIHFQLMQISFEPYQATTIGSLTSWIIFLVIINFGVKIVQLFKSSNI